MRTVIIGLGVFSGCLWYAITTILWLHESYLAALVSFIGTVLWWGIAAYIYHKGRP